MRKTDAEKAAHREEVLGFPASTDAAMQSLLEKRKAEAGMTGRGDITTFVDFIDADEGAVHMGGRIVFDTLEVGS